MYVYQPTYHYRVKGGKGNDFHSLVALGAVRVRGPFYMKGGDHPSPAGPRSAVGIASDSRARVSGFDTRSGHIL